MFASDAAILAARSTIVSSSDLISGAPASLLAFVIPSRGLIGFRTIFLTETRGTGIAHHVFEGYEPWAGVIKGRANGSLVADRAGASAAYAMFNIQERGSLFIKPQTEVYEGGSAAAARCSSSTSSSSRPT